jgi:hypothetical protein
MPTIGHLPVLLDYPWATSACLFAVASTGLLLMATRVVQIADHPAKLAAVVLVFIATLWSGAYFATWSARIDTEGMAVHAPFDIRHRQGAITWRDAATVAIGGRRSFYQLRVVSRDGTTAEIPLTDLPTFAVGPLATVVARRTVHVEKRQRPRDYFILAYRATRSVRGITTMRVQEGSLRLAHLPPVATR